MNKIEQLLQKYCPDGVEFKELWEVCDFKNGFSFKSTKFKENWAWIIRITNIKNKYIDTNNLVFFDENDYKESLQSYKLNKWDILVAMSGATTWKIWILETDYVCYLNQRVGKFVPDREVLDNQYLYHFLLSKINDIYVLAWGWAQPNLSSVKLMKTLIIPFPPIEIQQEIVKILDTFTKLEAELEAELEARKKQYEYYRDEMLSFGDEVELWDIWKVSMCKRIFKNETHSEWDVPFYKIWTFWKEPNSFISKEIYNDYKNRFSFPKKWDILISASGTIWRTVIYNWEDAYFQDSNIVWIDNDETKVTNKYLFYIYQIIKWQTDTGWVISRLYNSNIKKGFNTKKWVAVTSRVFQREERG